MFKIVSKHLNFSGIICQNLDKNFEYVNEHKKIFEKEYKSLFEDYRGIDQGEKAKYVNDKLSNLPIHNKFKKIKILIKLEWILMVSRFSLLLFGTKNQIILKLEEDLFLNLIWPMFS